MKQIVRDGERRVLLDTEKDAVLWSGRKNHVGQNSPNRWSDMHLHRGKSGPTFYFAHYTCWQGEKNSIEAMSLDDAQRFAEEHYDELDADDEELTALGLIDLEGVE
jgi:hypothetical protein